MLRNTFLLLSQQGKPDLSFFAADCFHFSRRGYAEMAVALWNNMVRGSAPDPCASVVAVPGKDREKGVWNRTGSKEQHCSPKRGAAQL